jgi:hypothetical protein
LREQRLYRSTHDSFEGYCRERFGHSRQRASFLIAAAQIYQRLSTIGLLLLPANERLFSYQLSVISYQLSVISYQLSVFLTVHCSLFTEKRLRGFQEEALSVEAAAYTILEKLGKLERPQLTALEEELLSMLEREYGTAKGSRRRKKT